MASVQSEDQELNMVVTDGDVDCTENSKKPCLVFEDYGIYIFRLFHVVTLMR